MSNVFIHFWNYAASIVFTCTSAIKRGRYHIETSSFICGANQWTGFYMITASVMKGLSLSTSNKNFETTNYSLERSFQKE